VGLLPALCWLYIYSSIFPVLCFCSIYPLARALVLGWYSPLLSWLLAASTLLGFTLAYYWHSSGMVLLLALFWLFSSAVLSFPWHDSSNALLLALL
jgi:hypothetical protein